MGTENCERNDQTLVDDQAQTTDLEQHNGGVGATNAPYIPIEIGENVIEGARQILEVIRPTWGADSLTFKLFTDGITNKLVGCFYTPQLNNNNSPSQPAISQQCSHHQHLQQSADSSLNSDVILVRVYGNKTDLLIDRKVELQNILLLQQHGLAPQLYGVFVNGLAYEFIPGVTLSPTSVIDAKVWPLVARHMARMHRLNISIPAANAAQPEPMIYHKTKQFLELIPEQFNDVDKHKRVYKQFLPVQRLRDEFNELYAHLVKLDSPIVFSHNDLLLGNVIYTEELERVSFIDYEYAGHNFQAFDIGNHFTEFVGIDEIDYARYPSKEFQRQWLRCYLEAYNGTENISDADVQLLYAQVNAFALASHFFWTIWALIQAEHSLIDFDFILFAQTRYEEYLAKKEEFLSIPTGN